MMKKIQATLVNVIRILGMFEAAAAVEAFRTTEKPPSSSSSSWSTLTWSHPMLRATHHHDQYEEDRHSNDNAPSHKDHEDTMPTTVVSYLDWLSNETTSDQSMRLLSLRLASDNKQRQVKEEASKDPNEGPYFRPLECNRPACQINTTWTEGGYSHHANNGTVIVPCGTCVWMDYSS